MDKLSHHIEALVFVAEHSLSFKEIKSCLDEQFDTKFKKDVIEEAISSIIEKYQSEDFSIEMVEISNGYRFMTKGAYYPTVATFLKQSTKKKLSKAALETLSIVAYKQPVEKSELEKIRGVNCDYSIQKLLEKELVSIAVVILFQFNVDQLISVFVLSKTKNVYYFLSLHPPVNVKLFI